MNEVLERCARIVEETEVEYIIDLYRFDDGEATLRNAARRIRESGVDDQTPIDLEWLKAVGFRDSGGCWFEVGQEYSYDTIRLEYYDDSDGMVLMLPSSGHHPKIRLYNRGQIRTLCRLFGITLAAEAS